MRRADHQRVRSVLIGKHNAYARAPKRDRRDLAYRLVPQGSRNIEGRKEISGPDRLRARSPGFDPITVLEMLRIASADAENTCQYNRRSEGNDSGLPPFMKLQKPAKLSIAMSILRCRDPPEAWLSGVANSFPFAAKSPIRGCKSVHKRNET
jgi:hypothetical protein